MGLTSHSDSGCGGLPVDDSSSQSKSYDTIGTIPRVGVHTASATSGETTEAFVARLTVEATTFRRRGEAAFSSSRYSESVRAFTVAINLVRNLSKEDIQAYATSRTGPSKHEQELSRLLYRRGSARLRLGGEDREAFHDLDQSLAIDPAQPLVFLQKGRALLKMKEHAGASRAFLGGLKIAPGHKDLQRLFYRSLRGVRKSRQRYVPEWRGKSGEKPASGADDGWIPHRLPSFMGERDHLIDPWDSREDPVVCAALIETNAYIDLDDVLEAEKEFCKSNGVSIRVEELRCRVQLVLADFRGVLFALFSEYCKREAGLAKLAVSPPTDPAALVAEGTHVRRSSTGSVGSTATNDNKSQASTSDESGDDGSTASSSDGTVVEEKPCGPPPSPFANADEPFDTEEDEENPSRLQRAGSPRRSQRPGPPSDGGPADGGAGAGGDVDGEGGLREYRTLVEELSITGTQFLDLVSNCTILEGKFFWAAAASVVHRVCRVGRELKTACAKENILGVRVGQCGEGGGTGIPNHRTAGGSHFSSPAANLAPRRPRANKHGRQYPARKSRRSSRTDALGDDQSDVDRVVAATNRPGYLDGGKPTGENTEAAGDGIEENQPKKSEDSGVGEPLGGHQPPERAGGPGAEEKTHCVEGEPPRATLGKEAALLKAAEVTDGGQGAMLFSEFVEALTRLCLARYAPRATRARTQVLAAGSTTSGAAASPGKAPAASPGKARGGTQLGVGWRKTSGAFAARGKSSNAPAGKPAPSGLALAHHRLRFAFQRHLLPEVVDVNQASSRRSNREIAAIMEVHAPRLSKMLEFFAVGGPNTVHWRGASPEPPATASSPPLKKTTPKAENEEDEDTSESSDSWTTSEEERDGAEAGDGLSPLSNTFPPRGDGPFRKRRPRPPAGKEVERRLSAREFVGMLRSLGTLDSRLTLREACKICATVTGFLAIIATKGGEREQKARPSSRRDQDSGLLGQIQEEQEEEALLAIGDDSLGPEEFARALYHCGDLKTWDGMFPISQRVGHFIVNDLFRRFLERTGEASLWWTRDRE